MLWKFITASLSVSTLSIACVHSSVCSSSPQKWLSYWLKRFERWRPSEFAFYFFSIPVCSGLWQEFKKTPNSAGCAFNPHWDLPRKWRIKFNYSMFLNFLHQLLWTSFCSVTGWTLVNEVVFHFFLFLWWKKSPSINITANVIVTIN